MSVKNELKEIRMRLYMKEPGEFSMPLNVNIKAYYHCETSTSPTQ